MKGKQTDTKRVLATLKQMTEIAIRQAKIEHIDGLLDTLAMREREIAKLYDFNPDDGLPAARRQDTDIPRWTCPPEYEDIAGQIGELDRELNRVLQYNMKKIRSQKKQLVDGSQYLKKVRSVYRRPSESRFLDHVG